MKHLTLAVIAVLICSRPGCSSGADPADLDTKEVFTRGLPQGLVFRGEMGRSNRDNYETWKESVQDQAGISASL